MPVVYGDEANLISIRGAPLSVFLQMIGLMFKNNF